MIMFNWKLLLKEITFMKKDRCINKLKVFLNKSIAGWFILKIMQNIYKRKAQIYKKIHKKYNGKV